MEISLLHKSTLRVKTKYSTFVVNPQDATEANAALMLSEAIDSDLIEETIVLQGAGEYEIAGVKISGVRNESNFVYTLHLEGVETLVGSIKGLTALQHKLKEHNVVIVNCDEGGNASFLTSLAINVVVFYGEKAEEIAQGFEKEKLQRTNKYTTSAGKLPNEVETILLA